MAEQFGFTGEDTHALAEYVYDQDVDAIAGWCEDHIQTHRDMHALLEFICRAISKIFPLALTKDVTLKEGEFWALEVGPTAAEASTHAARMITASLNGDWPSVTALIRATLSHSEQLHHEVLVELLVGFRAGMQAAAPPETT